MSKQLDRIEERLEELASLVGSVAWYFEEAMDYLAVLDQEIMRIQDKLGIVSPRYHPPPDGGDVTSGPDGPGSRAVPEG